MKNTISYAVTSIIITFIVVLCICVMNAFVTINKANDYHQLCIAELQASNFASSIVNKYQGSHNGYTTSIVNKTIKNEDENLEKTGRVYAVDTTYDISIPVINYKITRTIHGFAR